ncbi:MAG TPA: hypothetical protein DDW49_08490 [Deltaproteobacteria bacterium]|nr:MAG: hypothetical protein A2048_05445 [Deltaproteobacteria bacterium GWA2_45_12]HBF13403.1 hypothetical protein [Deltaproteobacteria bacterium]
MKTKNLFFTVLLLLISVGTGYAKNEPVSFIPASPPPEGYALVYVCRLKALPMGGRANVMVDKRSIVKISNHEYTWFYLKEGPHRMKIRWSALSNIPNLEFNFPTKSQQTYFLKITTGAGFNLFGGNTQASVQGVDETTALQELTEIRSYEPANIQKVD